MRGTATGWEGAREVERRNTEREMGKKGPCRKRRRTNQTRLTGQHISGVLIPAFKFCVYSPLCLKLLFPLSNTIHLLVMFNSDANNAFLRECINYLGFHYCYYEGSTAARCAVSRRLSLSPSTETNSSAFSTINTL